MCVMTLLATALHVLNMKNQFHYSEVKLLLVREPYLLFLGNPTVVDRLHRVEGVQGKHRWKKRHTGTWSSQLCWHFALPGKLKKSEIMKCFCFEKWTWKEYFHTKRAFHTSSELYFSHFIEFKKNQNQDFSTIYSLHTPGAVRFWIFWPVLCPQSNWGHGFLWVTLYKARIGPVFEAVNGLSDWKYIMPLLLFPCHPRFSRKIPERLK